jgi:DtxR family Mn-dependent transcriptional regulator
MPSQSEENYLKIIYKLEREWSERVTTNAISEIIGTKASSVTDMLKKLAMKEWIHYVKYQDISLTEKGRRQALLILRKHRIWETFLVEKLGFANDEVHDIAEELEHVQSEELVNRLEAFLNFPALDPHGGRIPDQTGVYRQSAETPVKLCDLSVGAAGIVRGIRETSPVFLRFLAKIGIGAGTVFEITDRLEFDDSLELKVTSRMVVISKEVASHLLVVPLPTDSSIGR